MQGLITKERQNLDPAAAPFARNPGEINGLGEGASLLEVVNSCFYAFVHHLNINILPHTSTKIYTEVR